MSDCDESDSPREVLLKRHRREKKELQGKIQGLKKLSSKGDKKKKKETLEEIARLEKDLEQRHNVELRQLEEQQQGEENHQPEQGQQDEELCRRLESVTVSTGDGRIQAQPRVSKAQKRRDKKAQKEKDRLAEIERQEEENKHGERQLEINKLAAKLKERSLAIVTIPSDGDCLFASVADQMQKMHEVSYTAKDLREQTVRELKTNSGDYLAFLTHPKTGDLLTESQFAVYCHDMENTAAWGGQVELRALSMALRVPIEVLQADGAAINVGEEEFRGKVPLVITYHRHMYGLGEHYNSTRKLN